MRTEPAPLLLGAFVAGAFLLTPAHAFVVLGTGNGALVGSDLTDLGDDGVEASYVNTPVTLPADLAGFDAVFFANNEANFRPNPGGPNASEGFFNVFDNLTGGGQNKRCCGEGGYPQIAGALFGNTLATGNDLIRLDRFTLTSSNDSPGRDPTEWTVQGSADTTTGLDGTWTTIFSQPLGTAVWDGTRNEVIAFSPGEGDTFLTDTTGFTDGFKAFRFSATAGGAFALGEIEFFGTVFTPVVPEPSRALLLGFGALGLLLRRRRS